MTMGSPPGVLGALAAPPGASAGNPEETDGTPHRGPNVRAPAAAPGTRRTMSLHNPLFRRPPRTRPLCKTQRKRQRKRRKDRARSKVFVSALAGYPAERNATEVAICLNCSLLGVNIAN
ncbi:hypothetical protein HPB50_010857 [Hyalomma asiaticum]|uniref:Uncharacterized protein n=1 Tax=Hyalomma asiaticum TaxID=266040 RepID=A0ACB7RNY3_HYAAI|nr:hypothetical protein HPB50_010857 [Hyalomma asiaticum]